ncbi:2-hydroxychromene-2-carboxylate isomerase [Rhodovulum sp. DZ06]|uniref:2-hydroxychromene-2-carboxylate isomerase n=1 Tax=Rhodovulum sp. DZ06 TaxID=3425126 RepID=UPI003D356460
MPVVDYYFSVLSPYAYLAGDRLERIAEANGALVRYKPVDIHKVFEVTGGIPVHRRHVSRQEYRFQDLARRARRAGLPMHLSPKFWPGNPTLANCALIAAQEARSEGQAPDGDVGAAARALMRALWAEQKDLADPGVVAEALAEGGFSTAVFSGGAAAGETYVRNTEEAVRRGVFGAPFYILGEERFWGQDRLEDLEIALRGGSANA